MSLTPKQEAFCCAYLETGYANEAYRRSYNASKMKPDVINVKASEMLAKGTISVRIQELREELGSRHKATVDTLLAELEAARCTALSATPPQVSAAVSATMGKAKLLGLDKRLLEVTGNKGVPFIAELVFVKPEVCSFH